MSTSIKPNTPSAPLLERGSYSLLARLTGIDRTSITRGLRGLRSLSLEDAALIARQARVSIDTVWRTVLKNRAEREQMGQSGGAEG